MAAGLSVSGLVVLSMMAYARMTIAPTVAALAAYPAAGMLLGGIRYRLRWPLSPFQMRARDFCEYVLLFTAISLLGVIASYPMAKVSAGFADARLAHADTLLHFDWVAWYKLVCAHRSLQWLGMAAYACIYVSPALLLGYFAYAGQRADARRFLATFWLAAVMTLLLFPLFPAAGPLSFLWKGPIPYMPTSALYQQQLIPVLRSHGLTRVDLGALRGLVCAPSFHTVCGVLYIVTAWPVRRLRWPLIGINAAMLLATPVEGTHYLIDMLIGAAVAIVAILLIRAAMFYMPGSPAVPTALSPVLPALARADA